jgi:hypothetical protein
MAAENALFGTVPDRYGYSRYSVVVHAPLEVADKVQCFRQEIGMPDFKTEPHVSISDTLYGLDDLNVLKATVRELASSFTPISILFSDPPFSSRTGLGVFEVQSTPQLLKLRHHVVQALSRIIKSHTTPGRSYWPHMTLYQRASEEASGRAAASGPALDLGEGFDALSLDFVGLMGMPGEGTRRIIEAFPFAG